MSTLKTEFLNIFKSSIFSESLCVDETPKLIEKATFTKVPIYVSTKLASSVASYNDFLEEKKIQILILKDKYEK